MSDASLLAVHIQHKPAQAALAHLLHGLRPGITLTFGPEQPDPPAYQVLVAGRPDRARLTASPALRALVIPWAGLPPATRELLHGFPHIATYNLHHNAGATAEMAIALLMAAAKFIVPADRGLRAHDWSMRYGPNPGMMLAGKTALILGYGAIGRRAARMCQGLGMRVLATRRSLTSQVADEIAEVYPSTALGELLPQADALIVCLPHTEETDGLLGARELAALSAGAVLVNVGRGPIIAEAALYEALASGHLRAAGLDVWYNYPDEREASRRRTPPSAYPFGQLDNVVLSPHRAGALGEAETERKRMDALAEALNALAAGKAPPGRIDVAHGY